MRRGGGIGHNQRDRFPHEHWRKPTAAAAAIRAALSFRDQRAGGDTPPTSACAMPARLLRILDDLGHSVVARSADLATSVKVIHLSAGGVRVTLTAHRLQPRRAFAGHARIGTLSRPGRPGSGAVSPPCAADLRWSSSSEDHRSAILPNVARSPAVQSARPLTRENMQRRFCDGSPFG
jgi:hypothetical protein